MLSEIGSNFWLKPSFQYKNTSLGTPKQFNCLGNDYVWLSTGRSAIGYVIKTIELRKPNLKKVAVLPSFTCDTVFEPFLKAGYDVFYYPVENVNYSFQHHSTQNFFSSSYSQDFILLDRIRIHLSFH